MRSWVGHLDKGMGAGLASQSWEWEVLVSSRRSKIATQDGLWEVQEEVGAGLRECIVAELSTIVLGILCYVGLILQEGLVGPGVAAPCSGILNHHHHPEKQPRVPHSSVTLVRPRGFH